MTPEELTAIGQARHGETKWIRPLAEELGFHRSTVWKAANGVIPVSRDLANAVKLLPKRKVRRLTSQQQPQGGAE